MRREPSSYNVVTAVEPVTRGKRGRVKAAPEKPPDTTPVTITIDAGGKRVVISVSNEIEADSSSSDPAHWHVDENGKIVWGDVHKKILGIEWKSREMPWHVVHPEDRRRVQDEWKEIMRLRAPKFAMRYRVQVATGEFVEVLHRGKPFFCDDEFCGFKGTIEVCR
jgi:hypothetical protein